MTTARDSIPAAELAEYDITCAASSCATPLSCLAVRACRSAIDRCAAALHDQRCDLPVNHPGTHQHARTGVLVSWPNVTDEPPAVFSAGLGAWRDHAAACSTCVNAPDVSGLCPTGAPLFAAIGGDFIPAAEPPSIRLEVVKSGQYKGLLSVRIAGGYGRADESFHDAVTRLFREGDLLTLALEVRR